MAEVQFAKAFLTNLDRKPIKLSSDFVSDPKKYPSQSPYILPKPSQPFPARAASTTSTPTSITVHLRPTKPPHTPLSLSDQDPSLVTILDLKTRYAQHASLDVAKIKVLYNKRPASDLKTLKDLLPTGSQTKEVELSIMVLGGGGGAAAAITVPETPRSSTPAVSVPDAGAGKMDVDSVGPGSEAAAAEKGRGGAEGSAGEVLGTEAFWEDLKGFLVQRLRDAGEGERLVKVFRGAAGR